MVKFLEGRHILSPDIWSKNFLVGWRNALIDSRIFWAPDVKKKMRLNPILCFIARFTKLLWDFTSELISLKYDFNIPFKITLTTIITVTSIQFPDGVHLNILPTLSSWYCFWVGLKRNLCEGLELSFKQ